MLWEIPSSWKCCTNSAEVNWLPWSECKIRSYGIAFVLENAFSSVSTAGELVIKELRSLATTLLSYRSIIEQLWCMIQFVSVIYVKSVHQTRFGCLGEKFRFNRFGIILWGNHRWHMGIFWRQIECSCSPRFMYCGLLFCSMRFLLFAESPSSYSAP